METLEQLIKQTDENTCPLCEGPMDGQPICPWCGYNTTERKMTSGFKTSFVPFDKQGSEWTIKHRLHPAKAIPVVLLGAVLGALVFLIGYFLMLLTILLNIGILVFIAYAAVFSVFYIGIGRAGKLLVNRWGRSNSTFWGAVISIMAILPGCAYQTYEFWASVSPDSAGGAVWAIIIGISIPVIGIIAIALNAISISEGKFCPVCASMAKAMPKIRLVHSCHTQTLIEALGNENGPEICDALQLPPAKITKDRVKLFVCKKCRKGFLEIELMRKYIDSEKKVDIDIEQVIAGVEIEGQQFEKWYAGSL